MHESHGVTDEGHPAVALVVFSAAEPVAADATEDAPEASSSKAVVSFVGESGPEPWDKSKTLRENLAWSPSDDDVPSGDDADGKPEGGELP